MVRSASIFGAPEKDFLHKMTKSTLSKVCLCSAVAVTGGIETVVIRHPVVYECVRGEDFLQVLSEESKTGALAEIQSVLRESNKHRPRKCDQTKIGRIAASISSS